MEIALFLTGDERGLRQELAVRRAMPELVEGLESLDLADTLLSKGVLSMEQWNDILLERNRRRRARLLISMLRRRRMVDYSLLLHFLEGKQEDLFTSIVEEYKNITEGKL